MTQPNFVVCAVDRCHNGKCSKLHCRLMLCTRLHHFCNMNGSAGLISSLSSTSSAAATVSVRVKSVGDWWEADLESKLFRLAEGALAREWNIQLLLVQEGDKMPVSLSPMSSGPHLQAYCANEWKPTLHLEKNLLSDLCFHTIQVSANWTAGLHANAMTCCLMALILVLHHGSLDVAHKTYSVHSTNYR